MDDANKASKLSGQTELAQPPSRHVPLYPLHRQQKMQRLARQLLKPRVLHVEPLRLLIQRVHNYRRGTDLNGNGKAALQRITQQRLADAFPLSILVNRKSRKDDHRNGIRPPLHKTFRRSLSYDAPSTHRIVTSDPLIPRRYIHRTVVGPLILHRVAVKPRIKRRLPAPKLSPIIRLLQPTGRLKNPISAQS